MKENSRVDPAEFVVRDKLYTQLRGYPEGCAAITEEALKHDFASINDLIKFIKLHKSKLPEPRDLFIGDYWHARDGKKDSWPHCSMLYTKILPKYGATFRRELQQKGIEPS